MIHACGLEVVLDKLVLMIRAIFCSVELLIAGLVVAPISRKFSNTRIVFMAAVFSSGFHFSGSAQIGEAVEKRQEMERR